MASIPVTYLNGNTSITESSNPIDTRGSHYVSNQSVPTNAASSAAMSLNESNSASLKPPGPILQSERLLTTRSRAVSHWEERGQRAYIKLLTTDPSRTLKRTSNGTSLGSSSKGPLASAVTKHGQDLHKNLGYADFIITDVRCTLDEKLQIAETFGDAEVTYYFGRQPIQFEFSGILIDSIDNNWFVQWFEMYSEVLRGSQLARNYELIKILLPNMEIVGHINRTSWSQNSARDVDIPFQFSFFAKEIKPIPVTSIGNNHDKSKSIGLGKGAVPLSQSGINSKKAAVKDLSTVIANPTSTVKDYSSALLSVGAHSVGYSSTILGGGDPIRSGSASAVLDSGYSSSRAISGGVGEDLPNIIEVSPSSNESYLSDNSSDQGPDSGGTRSVSLFSNLSGVRASLFSPVYGVLSSLTQLVKKSTGDVSKVTSTFNNPVREIMRDVRNVSNQSIGIVNMVNTSTHSSTSPTYKDRDLVNTLSLLKKTNGIIPTSLKSISSEVAELVHSGKLPLTSKFLKNTKASSHLSGTGSSSKGALLSSGKKYTAELGAKLK